MTSEGKSDSEIVFEVVQAAEGGFVARAVGQSIFTQGGSIEEVREAVREAVACHLNEEAVPRVIRLRIVLEEVLRP
jgi:hypothetical protein